ncbi:hypothetical protein GOBAR_DD03948 [Gossypium barbadense]|nr:hypothetical protein GOBAR_DD03948 [Gossypium barbadense]
MHAHVHAHDGEGGAYFLDDGVLDRVLHSGLAPLRYCDDDGNPTEAYPFNLNVPFVSKDWNVDKKGPSPWLRMFQNTRESCS